MTAAAAQIAQLRRMVNEPTQTAYTDDQIKAIIEAYPLMDSQGELPTIIDASTTPPGNVPNPNWSATYDLNAAAADIWEEKAALLAAQYDFNADGASYSRSQAYEQYMSLARHYRSRRSVTSIRLIQQPREQDV